MNEFDRILSAVTLESVIGQHVELKRAGSATLKGCCPFHTENNPSFFVYTGGGKDGYHCFGCGENGGDAVDYLSAYLDCPPGIALQQLAQMTGQAPPVFKKRSDRDDRRDNLAAAIWNALPTPTDSFGLALVQQGWAVKRFDFEIIRANAAGVDVAARHELGIPDSGLGVKTRWLVAGRRLSSADRITSGFMGLSLDEAGKVRVSSRGASRRSSIAFNEAQGQTPFPKDSDVVVTHGPLSLIKSHNRRTPAIAPTAANWRHADVRDAIGALPGRRFVIDTRHCSDASFNTWVRASGPQSIGLFSQDVVGSEPVPALSARVARLSDRFLKATTDSTRLVVLDEAQSFLKAMDSESILLNIFGKELLRSGVPVTYASESHVDDDDQDVEPIRILPDVAAPPLSQRRMRLLEFALMNLPFVDADEWKLMKPSIFSGHEPIAAQITSLADHLKTHRDIPLDRVSQLFFERIKEDPAAKKLAEFWWNRLARDPDFWESLPDPHSEEAELRRQELQEGVRFTVQEALKESRLSIAYSAHVDPDAESRLQASYAAPR